MNDVAIRQRVLERMADGRLPRHIPITAQPVQPGQRPETVMVVGSAFRTPCVVCDASRTQVRYNASTGAIAFHQRCHQIWTEEVSRLLRLRRIAGSRRPRSVAGGLIRGVEDDPARGLDEPNR